MMFITRVARDLWRKHEGAYLGAGASTPNVETYGRSDIDPDTTKPGLQVEITVDDPATFTVPWTASVTYSHVPGEWPEAVCAENTQGSGSSWVNLVPRAEKCTLRHVAFGSPVRLQIPDHITAALHHQKVHPKSLQRKQL
jgi:hypothetical protein